MDVSKNANTAPFLWCMDHSGGGGVGTMRLMIRLKVKEVIQEKGMSMGKLSRASDVALITVSRMCNQPTTYSPTLDTLERIARALGVHVADLFEEVPDETNN